MSKTFQISETSIPAQVSINLKDDLGLIWLESRTEDLYRVFFSSVADFLKSKQSKEANRIGFRLKDDNGKFKFGAILNFQKPEDDSEEDSGNWYLEFTFYESDMENLDVELDNFDTTFNSIIVKNSLEMMYARFRSVDFMYGALNVAIDTLIKFLDTNASETETVDVSQRGIFIASVAIEDGEKVMSIVPGEVIKQIIKNDSAL